MEQKPQGGNGMSASGIGKRLICTFPLKRFTCGDGSGISQHNARAVQNLSHRPISKAGPGCFTLTPTTSNPI